MPYGFNDDKSQYDLAAITDRLDDLEYDTGWVDISSHLNTTNFTVRTGYAPMARRVGNVVYFRGQVYCSTAPGGYNVQMFKNIPSQFRPTAQTGGGGMKYGNTGKPYYIYVSTGGSIIVSESSSIVTTTEYNGYDISSISPYPVG